MTSWAAQRARDHCPGDKLTSAEEVAVVTQRWYTPSAPESNTHPLGDVSFFFKGRFSFFFALKKKKALRPKLGIRWEKKNLGAAISIPHENAI